MPLRVFCALLTNSRRACSLSASRLREIRAVGGQERRVFGQDTELSRESDYLIHQLFQLRIKRSARSRPTAGARYVSTGAE